MGIDNEMKNVFWAGFVFNTEFDEQQGKSELSTS